jgi:putative transcriptional regulator
MEKGKYSPSLELAFNVAKVFDKKIDEIFIFE